MDSGTTAWILISSALVLFMTPGLAFFYGGMVRSKNVLAMLMKNYIAMGVVTITWVIVGCSLAFSSGNVALGDWGLFGDLDLFGLTTLDLTNNYFGNDVPDLLHVTFQLMFAIITPALIAGAVAERMKFTAWVAFVAIWSICVYAPMAHWVWGGGFIGSQIEAIDFAGGLVVHINAGAAALALIIVLGPRVGLGTAKFKEHSLPLTVLGAGILWFGWFGFNAGSAYAADGAAANAFITTQIAAAVAATTWIFIEAARNGKPTSLGFACGAVAGLVAITPAAGFVNPLGAIIIGIAAGAICLAALQLKERFNFDDSLDVVAVHLVGGVVGALLLGLLADEAIGGIAGSGAQFVNQLLSVIIAIAFSFIATYVIAVVLDRIIGLRVNDSEENQGLDSSLHGEQAYAIDN